MDDPYVGTSKPRNEPKPKMHPDKPCRVYYSVALDQLFVETAPYKKHLNSLMWPFIGTL